MIKIENVEVTGWESAIRGMRNPMNSWDMSDSEWVNGFVPNTHIVEDYGETMFVVGERDLDLMQRLARLGSVHGKFLRMITVTVDITAPLYWWKEFDTYKVGTVANSCSTMHKIHSKEFSIEDFSVDHLNSKSKRTMESVINALNTNREIYLETKDKKDWWQIIQLLPSSYNQKRTVQLNYEVLRGMRIYRKEHKLDCWVDFCKWMKTLPLGEELICYD